MPDKKTRKETSECESGFDLKEALENASDGDTIFIPPGTYEVPNILSLRGKNVWLRGSA